ncbi:hypothetical protein APS14_14185 [Pseudomonas thivervalensis]|nr:hypothetical protein APS14_14185 [Pseudomonas thivervalensis]
MGVVLSVQGIGVTHSVAQELDGCAIQREQAPSPHIRSVMGKPITAALTEADKRREDRALILF